MSGAPLLHARFPGLAGSLPHLSLGARPTPVRRLEGVGGAEVWLKDDGAFGDGGWGGNKVRKLEWILPDARRRGATTVLTFGALATNHGLATALYAREHGLRAALVLVDQPVDDHVRTQLRRLEASGAALYHTKTKPRTARDARAAARDEGLELDPVYTAKAFAGLRAMAAEGAFGGGPVLFVNTHGPR